ncbi:cell division protein ZapE [Verminephrobacter sp. Larva24]|nr:cell division protein ZapE [Verminephrobacter sp. Larva24]
MHSSASNSFWQAVKKGMDEACTQVQAQCRMIFTQTEGAVPEQVSNLQAAMAGKPDAIITTIVDDKAIEPVIKDARSKGITVLAANADHSQGAKGSVRQSFIGQGFDAAGYTLGQKLAEKFPKTGPINVLVGVSAPGQNWSEQRGAGIIRFLADYKAANSGRTVAWKRIDSGTDLAVTAERVGAYLNANPDTTAYFDTGLWHAGVAKVLKDRGVPPGKILLAGFDIVPDVLSSMKAGYIQVILARRKAGGLVWFDFKTLCAGPRSQNDYLEIATRFHTLLLSDVPCMPVGMASAARRFTWLVDVLYDRRVKLILSAAVPPEQLYTAGPLVHEFPRTVSRLHEMQSRAFLALARRSVDTGLT